MVHIVAYRITLKYIFHCVNKIYYSMENSGAFKCSIISK